MSDRAWITWAVTLVTGLTVLRIWSIWITPTDLFVDEAQYWLWGQHLDFGYYSKPPLIAWVIRAFSGLGTVDPFWVRLPAPLFHFATSGALAVIASSLWGKKTAAITAILYISLPFVGVGSALISTDTIMFPFLAGALGAYLNAAKSRSLVWAFLCGALLGIAAMGKYAAFYYVLCFALTMIALPAWRLSLGQIGLALFACLIAISPNLHWNFVNGFSTAQHTLDNADWVRDPGTRAAFSFENLGSFLGAQAIVLGPVVLVVMLVQIFRAPRRVEGQINSGLALMSCTILLIVSTQAFLSEAYANWAVAAYLPAALLVAKALEIRPVLRAFALGTNLIFCLALLGAIAFADRLKRPDGNFYLARYLGINAISYEILNFAQGRPIIASNRDILANLFFVKNADQDVFAIPSVGRANNHYALKFAYPGGLTELVYVRFASKDVPCSENDLGHIAPTTGHYAGKSLAVSLIPGSCFSP